MKIGGLTGGIGSGKTTVASMFNELGIPVYIADVEAKRLMVESEAIVSGVTKLFGAEAYVDGVLNRSYIASQVFDNKEKLTALNSIVHPAVHQDFKDWVTTKNAPYVLKEAAIIFENEGEKKLDFTILVTAPIETRIDRVLKRDKTDRDTILKRMNNQWSDDKKRVLATYCIENIDVADTREHVKYIHNQLIEKI
ncbi:dephospho-CoA kinase [Spongiivirga citrea]|uniref:Dephospho-CoA kinase n=1 Tax=Spongiivirga citrea TaxID=1481457 RepID=A0A6M0CIA1_9FLAO|nr:dephospho-CoA kinase [Spongiivirga citrea]NER17601.1 dephospho-CoA kinase [Spongiivirga citrea]